jgi:hypothetical protein
MSLLRSLRNLSVLMIFAVAVLSLLPHSAGAQSSCKPLGTACRLTSQCCAFICGPITHRCCEPLRLFPCTSSAQCCSRSCIVINGQGKCM